MPQKGLLKLLPQLSFDVSLAQGNLSSWPFAVVKSMVEIRLIFLLNDALEPNEKEKHNYMKFYAVETKVTTLLEGGVKNS